MITAEEWYDSNPNLKCYEQGDIIADVPFFVFPNYWPKKDEYKWRLLRPRNPKRAAGDVMKVLPIELIADAAKNVNDRWKHPHGECFIAAAKRMNVMIVTRSCAITRDSANLYLVAPVIRFEDLHPDEKSDERMKWVRELEMLDWFYLPPGPLEEGFADLSQLMPVHWSFFGDAPKRETFKARLTSFGTHKLQFMLSESHGTIFGFDLNDICPQTTEYACSRCFYNGVREPSRQTFEEGKAFGECQKCKELTAWVKLPMGVSESTRPQLGGKEQKIE